MALCTLASEGSSMGNVCPKMRKGEGHSDRGATGAVQPSSLHSLIFPQTLVLDTHPRIRDKTHLPKMWSGRLDEETHTGRAGRGSLLGPRGMLGGQAGCLQGTELRQPLGQDEHQAREREKRVGQGFKVAAFGQQGTNR